MTNAMARFIEARAGEYDALALDIWEHPETAGNEARSSGVHRDRLAASGFAIREFPELAYSFAAEKGSGGPVIALMGEYDALPGMSQACAARREPRERGSPGHACGHNLLGMGSLAAAEALAAALGEAGVSARVRYYGCPAEEALGRIPLVKAGRFDDVDAALTWHPADVNTPHRYTTSANIGMVFRFKGRASHAAMAPHAGRSALDGVQLFNLGLEFLREHVEKGTLIHYVISDGGQRPNIVPESAATTLYLRAPTAEALRRVSARVVKVAKGAAMMTETRAIWEVTHGKCDFIPNDAIHDRVAEAMRLLPPPVPDATELAFAKAMAATVPRRDRESTLSMIGAPLGLLRKADHGEAGDFGSGYRIGGSLDTGDVSYVTPTGQLNAATWPLGIGAHTWQSCAASASSLALARTRWAAAILAAVGYALATEPALLAAAKAEHRAKAGPYRSTMDL